MHTQCDPITNSVFCIVCFFELYLVYVFSCTALFVSISQVIGCEDRLRNDLEYCTGRGVKLCAMRRRTVPGLSPVPLWLFTAILSPREVADLLTYRYTYIFAYL